jgi:hypothetical protein
VSETRVRPSDLALASNGLTVSAAHLVVSTCTARPILWQVGTTPRVAFRAVVGANGKPEVEIVLLEREETEKE